MCEEVTQHFHNKETEKQNGLGKDWNRIQSPTEDPSTLLKN